MLPQDLECFNTIGMICEGASNEDSNVDTRDLYRKPRIL